MWRLEIRRVVQSVGSEFDVVTLDRIKKIDVEENYEVWKEYARQAEIYPAILSYLEIRREHFYRIETTVDGKAFVTARGWEDLSELLYAYERLGKKADREVVHQYLQHWKVAKEFANYLELYAKYQKDYGLEKIVGGIYSKETLEQLRYAAFDERLSVVNMLLGRLMSSFRDYALEDRYVTMVYEHLKVYKETKEFESTLRSARENYEKLRQAEQLTRLEDRLYRRMLETLEGYGLKVEKEHLEGEEAFDRVKELFAEAVACRELIYNRTKEALEHAFDFMEDAFGDSQEMVAFVTELNTSVYSVRFLKDYDCDKIL